MFTDSWHKTVKKDIEIYESLLEAKRKKEDDLKEDEETLKTLKLSINQKVSKAATRRQRINSYLQTFNITAMGVAILGVMTVALLAISISGNNEVTWDSITSLIVLYFVFIIFCLIIDILILVVFQPFINWLYGKLSLRQARKAIERANVALNKSDTNYPRIDYSEYLCFIDSLDPTQVHQERLTSAKDECIEHKAQTRAKIQLLEDALDRSKENAVRMESLQKNHSSSINRRKKKKEQVDVLRELDETRVKQEERMGQYKIYYESQLDILDEALERFDEVISRQQSVN